MSTRQRLAIAVLAGAGLSACASGVSVDGGDYYGSGWYDPWYYGQPIYTGDILVTPPPRPDRERPVTLPATDDHRPSIPSQPRPVTLPATVHHGSSIPSARPISRPGGRR